MPAADSLSTWATMVLMLPFGILLAMALLGVDEKLAKPKGRRTARVRFCEARTDGASRMADPDGQAWDGRTPEFPGECEARPPRDPKALQQAGKA